jgi:hypothetical protein
MYRTEDRFWIRLWPDTPRQTNQIEWREHGGKWIIFNDKDQTVALAERLEPFIETGTIESAKYWNRDPSAICVYSLDREKEKVRTILEDLGAGRSRVWEYDYAWDKNFRSPLSFLYSQSSKLRTILRGYGCRGSWQLLKEVLTPDSKLIVDGKEKKGA